MDIIFLKIFLFIIIILFLIGFIGPVIIIKKTGRNPHGTDEGASILTRLSAVFSLTWLIYLILFFFIDDIILNILVIQFLVNDFSILFGMSIVSIGFIFEFLGMIALGLNFRIGFPKEETELITSGIYRIMRNPILFGTFLLLIGSFFIIPSILCMILVIFNIITFNSKAIDEEKFLRKRFGTSYEQYQAKVGRYLPITFKNMNKKRN